MRPSAQVRIEEEKPSAWEGLNPPYSTIVVDPPWHYEGFAGPPVCVCGHDYEDHYFMYGFQPCNFISCDCDDFEEVEGP